MRVYRSDGESVTEVARLRRDGTVEGDTNLAKHFRGLIEQIRQVEPDPDVYMKAVAFVVERRYQTGYTFTEREWEI